MNQTSSQTDLVNYARLLDAHNLFNLSAKATTDLGWGPVADDGLFFDSNAAEELRRGHFDSRKPVMCGTVSFDGSSFLRDTVFTHDNFKHKVFGHIRNWLKVG